MAGYLPDGCTQDDLDRWHGDDLHQEPDEPELESMLLGEFHLTEADLNLLVGKIEATWAPEFPEDVCPF